MKTLEFASDVMVQRGFSNLSHHADRTVQQTPDQPDFWFGNRVIYSAPPDSAARLMAQFQNDLPGAKHICLGWDIPNLSHDVVEGVFQATDLKVESADTLVLSGPLMGKPVPEGVHIRPFETPNDWLQSEAIAKTELLKDGTPEEGLDAYLRGASAQRRRQISKGFGQWFGAFIEGMLVADMGIFHDEELIRYQSVQTHENHRRKGMCSALLQVSLNWALARAPNARPVIVADSDGDAGRLYRKAGFSLFETTISAYRPPV